MAEKKTPEIEREIGKSMKKEEGKLIRLKLKDIKPYKNNAKIHTEKQIGKIRDSIISFGYKDLIAVDENNVILEGHGRLRALYMIDITGYKEIQVWQITDFNKSEKKAYRIAHNKLTMSTDFDNDILSGEFNELEDTDNFNDTGFDQKEITEIWDEVNPKEIVEDIIEVGAYERAKNKTSIKLGEVYTLGNNRLMCGDSTESQQVEKLMKGEKADMVFTDPPYGMKKEKDGIMNDNLNYNDLLEFNKKWIAVSFQNMKDNTSWYCWGTDEPLMDIYSNILKPMISQNLATFRNLITWDKGNGQGQLAEEFRMYPTADEKCLFVMTGVQGFSTNSDNYYYQWDPIRIYLKEELKKVGDISWAKRTAGHSETSGCHWFDKSQWTMPTEEVYNSWKKAANDSAFKKEYSEIKKEYYGTRAYFNNTHDNMNNVWHFGRDTKNDHSTPKPIDLCARAIKSSSREQESILDLFGGSGSTLIACEQLDRKCYMMELDPVYCQVIIDRWEKFTNKQAIKI